MCKSRPRTAPTTSPPSARSAPSISRSSTSRPARSPAGRRSPPAPRAPRSSAPTLRSPPPGGPPETGAVAGWEALARGPQGSALERPDLLFAAAERAGRVDQLDWECRVAAVRGALDAGIGRRRALFINVEPRALGTPVPEHLARD